MQQQRTISLSMPCDGPRHNSAISPTQQEGRHVSEALNARIPLSHFPLMLLSMLPKLRGFIFLVWRTREDRDTRFLRRLRACKTIKYIICIAFNLYIAVTKSFLNFYLQRERVGGDFGQTNDAKRESLQQPLQERKTNRRVPQPDTLPRCEWQSPLPPSS